MGGGYREENEQYVQASLLFVDQANDDDGSLNPLLEAYIQLNRSRHYEISLQARAFVVVAFSLCKFGRIYDRSAAGGRCRCR